MKLTKVHLFVLLLLALVLCSFFGGACGGSLEGFNMPSDSSSSYDGNGQYSANKQKSKQQDALNGRMDKQVSSSNPNEMDDDVSKYAPYSNSNSSANAGASATRGRSQGIPASQIPSGQEDLYILKSEIVPPVCPACPSVKCDKQSMDNSKCPPCPPCARCPEPSFECKKVPNYRSSNEDVLPRPVLNSFSQFGL